jgi:hypothetical protein
LSDPLPNASDYEVFGLRIRSDIPLPELSAAEGVGEADVTISAGVVPESEAGPGLQVHGDALLLTVPEVSRYRIEAGRNIIVDAEPGVPERNVRLYLLGSAFGALLHQRGLLPLHANAVEIDGRAVAFMGASGEGKSTLAAWFHDHGYRVIADDVCVVNFKQPGRPCAAPGLPRLRLWREALERMGRDASEYDRSYVETSNVFDKFDVPLGVSSAADAIVPLGGIYLLERGSAFSVAPINGVEAAEAIFANTYRGSYVFAAGAHHDHWRSSIELVRNVEIYRARRRWGLTNLDDQCCRLLECATANLALAQSGGRFR